MVEDRRRFLTQDAGNNEWFVDTDMTNPAARDKVKEFLHACIEAGFRVHVTCMMEGGEPVVEDDDEEEEEEEDQAVEVPTEKKAPKETSKGNPNSVKEKTPTVATKTSNPTPAPAEDYDGTTTYDPWEAAQWYEEAVASEENSAAATTTAGAWAGQEVSGDVYDPYEAEKWYDTAMEETEATAEGEEDGGAGGDGGQKEKTKRPSSREKQRKEQDWYEETGDGPPEESDWYEETGEGPPEESEETEDDGPHYDCFNELVVGVRKKQQEQRRQQKAQAQSEQEKAREKRRKKAKREMRQLQRKRPNPFPSDKRTARMRRAGDPTWRGVLWLDSIHAVNVNGVNGVKTLFACLVREFVEEAIW